MKDFTSQQREIVARKLGYDGPMQGFDEFIASSPSLGAKYAAITGKFAERMAKGGLVKMKRYATGGAVTDEEVANWWDNPANKKLSDTGIKSAMDQYGVTPDQFARATKSSLADVQSRYDAVGTTTGATTGAAATGGGTGTAIQGAAGPTLVSTGAGVAPNVPTATGTVSTQEIKDYLANNPNLTDAQIAAKMNEYKVTPDQMATATGLSSTEIQNRYNVATGVGASDGGGFDMQVVVYGPDGTSYDSPAAARAAGVTNYTSSPSASTGGTTGAKKPTLQEVQDYLKANPNLSDAQIAAKMKETGATVDQIAAATGLSVAEVQRRYNIATGAGGVTTGGGVTYTDIGGKPVSGTAAQVSAAQITGTAAQDISTVPRGGATAGRVGTTATAAAGSATADQVAAAETYKATAGAEGITTALSGVTGAQGTLSDQAQMSGQTGTVSDKAIAATQKFDEAYKDLVEAGTRTIEEKELITGATAGPAVTAEAQTTTAPTAIKAQTRDLTAEELTTAATISEENMAKATAIVADGLNVDAKVVAQRLEKFTVTDETLAQAAQGNVDAMSTVQGQLTSLMKSFDDGKTPAWAAGAIRAANAAMSARGLGNSSMAGAAIFQAAMESALPIAQQDAQVFANMGLTNLNNRQQVALTNAAAQQGLSLANLNNAQQAALQNSTNAFALQSQNLSNQQQVVVANAQIKASLQGQMLSNQQQASLANASRYAEVNNINLNNMQQTALVNSSQALQVDLVNLSNKQQTVLANAQIAAALQGKELDNKQQAAVLNAAKFFDANNLTFTADQQAQLQNSQLMQTIGLANLNAAQAATIANAATYAAMDMANLNNRQQAAVVNAQAFLAIDMKNLDNAQQTALFKAQATTQAMLADTASDNAAKQFNAASTNQVNQFNASLATQVSQFNASQVTAINQFNAGETNAITKFNTESQNQRDQFNATQSLIIDQANAQWQRDISTANTAATNAANLVNAQLSQQMSVTEYNNEIQMYRDGVTHAWQSSENDANRSTTLAAAELAKSAQLAIADATAAAANARSLGELTAAVIGKTSFTDIAKAGSTVVDLAKEAFDFIFG